MSQKMARKVRQVFRKNQNKFWSAALKPKPKWVPWKLWKWGMSIFIKIDK